MQSIPSLPEHNSPSKATQPSTESASSPPTPPPRPRSRRRIYVGLAALMIALFAGMIVWHLRTTPRIKFAVTESKPAPAKVPDDVVFVEKSQLESLTIEPVAERDLTIDREATGKVGFNEDRLTPVFPAYAGRVVEVLANKGQVVRQGQPLLVIESPDLVAAQNDLTTAHSDVERAAINLQTAQTNAERARNLFAREAMSKKDLQDNEAALALAQREMERAQAALRLGESKLSLFGKSPAELDKLKGNIDRRVTITAPISGTIVDRQVGLGQIIKTDAGVPLFQLSDLSVLWVQADVFESDLANIRLGTPVEIRVESYPDRPFTARVSYIDPRVDPATRTVRVRCQVSNSGGLLKPDMFAKIKIVAAAKQSVPVIPASAVVSQGEKMLVLVEEGTGRFRKREIVTGNELDGNLTIKDGLKAGERIITKGALLLNQD